MNNNLKEYSIYIKLSIFSLIIFLVTLSIYSNTLVNEFTEDEVKLIKENRDVYRLPSDNRSSVEAIVDLFSGRSANSQSQNIEEIVSGKSKYKTPMTTLSWIVDRLFSQLTGAPDDDAELYHLSNVLLHATLGVQVFLFTIHLTTSLKSSSTPSMSHSFGNDLACFIGSLLFVLHPVNGEIVASIGSGRSVLLSCNFVMLSLLTYRYSLIGSLVCFLLGSLAGGIAYALMLLLPLYHYILRGNLRSFIVVAMLLISVIQYILASAYFSPFSYYINTDAVANGEVDEVYGELRYVDNHVGFESNRLTRLLTIDYSHAHYLWLLLVPKTLSVDWSYNCLPTVQSLTDKLNIQTLLTYSVIFLPLLFTNVKKQSVVILFYILFGVINMIPKLNLFFYTDSLVSENNLYLPSIAFCILLGRLLTSPFLLIDYKEEQQQQRQQKEKEKEIIDNNNNKDKEVNNKVKEDSDDNENESIVRRRKKLQKEMDENDSNSNNRLQKNKKNKKVSLTTTSTTKNRLSIINKLLIAISLTATISITILYSLTTYQRNFIWRDKVNILFDSLNSCSSVKLNDEIAGLYIKAEDWNNAKLYCENALDILPSYCLSNYKYGMILLHTNGDYIEASKYFAKSIGRGCRETQQMTWMTVDELYQNLMSNAPESFTDLRVQFAELVESIDPELAAKHLYDAAMIEFETNENLPKSQTYMEHSLDIVLDNHKQIPLAQWCKVFEYIGSTFEPAKQSKLEKQLNKALSLCTKTTTTTTTTKTTSSKKRKQQQQI
ncbi:hypothetical protein PPL_08337 [Heterostelium album PN500]|uniref:DUF1736 domain-containing protein n=1 Tax=Heterostelium pallidum (strain ATCC 26659 / Pp 5 / PN500) TaxID=670386 RepID=D3BHW9_HETP5|nr:hypothetical protein PPL_08337 [Heterostelium album PN500]EFA78869.1 hypothetical protein PPL_08337 [Heterostelium album PN500]|eukprot:XP_020430993.1 hypothetical protein PPL_08337 [Heterostelium album PN500]